MHEPISSSLVGQSENNMRSLVEISNTKIPDALMQRPNMTVLSNCLLLLLTIKHSSSVEPTARTDELALFKDPKLSIPVVFDGA